MENITGVTMVKTTVVNSKTIRSLSLAGFDEALHILVPVKFVQSVAVFGKKEMLFGSRHCLS